MPMPMRGRECALTLRHYLRDDAAARAGVPVLGRVRVSADMLRDPLRLRRPALLLDVVGDGARAWVCSAVNA
jgi:hypothetical protein